MSCKTVTYDWAQETREGENKLHFSRYFFVDYFEFWMSLKTDFDADPSIMIEIVDGFHMLDSVKYLKAEIFYQHQNR